MPNNYGTSIGKINHLINVTCKADTTDRGKRSQKQFKTLQPTAIILIPNFACYTKLSTRVRLKTG